MQFFHNIVPLPLHLRGSGSGRFRAVGVREPEELHVGSWEPEACSSHEAIIWPEFFVECQDWGFAVSSRKSVFADSTCSTLDGCYYQTTNTGVPSPSLPSASSLDSRPAEA